MKSPIFLRMMYGILIPAVFVFIVIIWIVDISMIKMIDDISAIRVENYVRNSASNFENIYINNYRNLSSDADSISDLAPEITEEAAQLFLLKSKGHFIAVDMIWTVFFPREGEKNHIKAGYKTSDDGDVSTLSALTETLIKDREKSTWLYYPYETGKAYVDPDFINFASEKVEKCGVISFPIKNSELEIVGVIAIKINYNSVMHILYQAETYSLDVIKGTETDEYFSMENAEYFRPNTLPSTEGGIVHQPKENLIMGPNGFVIYSESGKRFENFIEENRAKNDKVFDKMLGVLLEKNIYTTEYNSPYFNEKSIISVIRLYIPEANDEIYFVSDISIDGLFSPANNLIIVVTITSICGLVLIIICIFYYMQDILNPIKDLINFTVTLSDAGSISEETFAEQFDKMDIHRINSEDELMTLKNAMQKMVIKIVESHNYELRLIENETEKERLLAASEAKTRFFANMSHEIRTPMNSVLGIAQILLMDKSLTDKQKQYISDIKSSSDALLAIINDILDLSKLESGKMALFPTDYDFSGMMKSLVSMLQFMTEQKNLKFIYEEIFEDGLTNELPKCLYGDNIRIRQILINICANAIKFTDVGFVKLSIFVKNDEISFTVKDSGRGISEEDKEMLFKAFEQFGDQSQYTASGTGLGLSISKYLAHLMGGSIEVESKLGEGSAFTLSIPKVTGDLTKLQAEESHFEVSFLKSTSILVVDDNEINLHVASGLLNALFGLECDTVTSGDDAIALIAKKHYDIVFMDHMMPEKDGIQTTKEIRAKGYTELVIIALTANAVVGTRETLIAAGMNDFLTKPISQDELIKMLAKWIPAEKRLNVASDFISSNNKKNIPKDDNDDEITIYSNSIPDIDMQKGLFNAAGRKDIYKKSLILLRKKLLEFSESFRELIKNGSYEEFLIHIHGLKSSLASVGADDFSLVCANLEKSTKEKNYKFVDDSLESLLERMEKLSRDLEKVCKCKNNSCSTEKDGTTLVLKDFCKSFEIELIDYNIIKMAELLKEVKEYNFDTNIQDVLNEMSLAIDNYNYGDISLSLEKLKEQVLGDASLKEEITND